MLIFILACQPVFILGFELFTPFDTFSLQLLNSLQFIFIFWKDVYYITMK